MAKTAIASNSFRWVPLKEVCLKISVGLAMSVTPHMRKEGVKLVRNQNIRPNFFDESSLVYLNENFAKSQQSKQVRAGDVISVRTGANIGDTCIVPDNFDGALTFTTLIARPNKKLLDSRYLSQYMNSSLGRSEVNRLMAGGGKGNLNSGELEKYLISLPPIAEQKKIAEILTTWDEAIGLSERTIRAKKKRKRALSNSLLSGKTRLLPDAEEWKIVNQGEVATFHNGRAYKLSEWELQGTPVIRLQNLTGRGDEYYYSTLQLPNHQYANNGDLLYMWSATFGAHIWRGEKAIYHYHIWKVACSDRIEKMYLYYLLNHLTQTWMSNTNGMGLLHITKSTMEKQKIPLPSLEEQKVIANVLEISDREISVSEAQLSLLKKQKQGLMQKLLTGEWRVLVQEAA